MSNQLWVDKHKPRTSAELVGNNALVNTLKAWLQQWRDIHIHHKQPQEVKGEQGEWVGIVKKTGRKG